MRRVAYCILLALATLAAACGSEDTPPQGTATLEQHFPLDVGGVQLRVQVPLAPAEQRNGLMRRESLPENEGMLFPYAEPQQMSFWMENVPIGLDIGFFDSDGVLREVHSMLPYDRNSVRSSRTDLRFALEVNKGWFARNNVLPGAKLDREQLADAIRARGENPRRFGL